MKKHRTASWILLGLSLAPLLIAFVAVRFLPDQIPLHYNAAGVIDAWGSKYTEYILAGIFAFSGLVFWFIALVGDKLADTEAERARAIANARVAVKIGIVVQAMMCALQVVILYGAWRDASMAASVSVLPIWKIVGIGCGILYILIGNEMPKTKPNNLMGVRTVWSCSSPEVWAKSQRAGGISFVVAGVLCIVFSLLLHGFVLFWIVMACTVIAAAVACVLSFKAAHALSEKE